jgi:hypothetical protein
VTSAAYLTIVISTSTMVPTAFNGGGPSADLSFQNGVAARTNADQARKHFAAAAASFDRWWQNGYGPSASDNERLASLVGDAGPLTPALALNRGHAHFLAGNLPQAIRAFHDGLAIAPYDAELQHSLAAARATIDYQAPADPAERIRPDLPGGLRSRLAPWDLYRAAAVCGVLVVVGLGKRFTTQPAWALPVAAAGGLGFLAIVGGGLQMHRERLADDATPVAVVAADGVTLRKGNGDSFPPRIGEKLPRGAEVRVIGRRGGWAQVELPGEAVGWLPEAALLTAQ